MRLILGTNNAGTAALTISGTTGTLVISGLQGFDLQPSNIAGIYNTTRTAAYPVNGIKSATSGIIPASGLETNTFTLSNVPGTWAGADVLVITLSVPVAVASYFVQVYNSKA